MPQQVRSPFGVHVPHNVGLTKPRQTAPFPEKAYQWFAVRYFQSCTALPRRRSADHQIKTMATTKPVIVVVHATSKQGSSVVKSLLQTGQFAVKALVRDANTDSASAMLASIP